MMGAGSTPLPGRSGAEYIDVRRRTIFETRHEQSQSHRSPQGLPRPRARQGLPAAQVQVAEGQGERRRVAGARRLRVRLPPGAHLRHGRHRLQPHLGADPGHGALPAQPHGPDVRRDLRLVADQGRPDGQGAVGAGVAEGPRLQVQPSRLRHPRRDPRGEARAALRDPHPFARRDGGVVAEEGTAADDADGDALQQGRVPRLRRRGARHRRARAPGRQPGRLRRDAPAQPRRAGGRRTVAEAFNNIYRLENACRAQLMAQGLRRRDRPAAARRAGEDEPRLQAGVRRTDGLLEWPAMRRLADRIDPSYRT